MKTVLFFQKLIDKIVHLWPFYHQKISDKDQLGKDGENRAVSFLKSQGYIIVAKNQKFTVGEIDIIAKFQKTLIVVEVKTRRSKEYCHPIEAVHKKKREKIKQMGLRYYRDKKYSAKGFIVRFDIITILWPDWPENKQPTIEHFVDAFR